MHIVSTIAGIFTVVLVLLDAFETIVLPRRIRREFRLSRVFYRRTWLPWRRIAGHIEAPGRRENFLGYFGPLSLIFLLALWACGLIFGFTLLQYGAGDHVQLNGQPVTFYTLIYHSGETFFTLGYGDIVPTSSVARFLAVFEAGMGFGFLGTVIGYIPTIYSSFSRREIEISMLDERAGSPSTASELLARMGKSTQQDVLDGVFRDWERWAAEVLESHLSYPALSFFRSQHNNQSWLGALTTVLDASSLVIAGVDGLRSDQARLTYAIARHAVVDLSQVVNARYDPNFPDRLPDEQMLQLRKSLLDRGVKLGEGPQFEQKLSYLRSLYEPYSQSIARNLLITLPPWIHDQKKKDNWQAGPWDRIIQARGLAILGQKIKLIPEIDDHF
jgi:ion channel